MKMLQTLWFAALVFCACVSVMSAAQAQQSRIKSPIIGYDFDKACLTIPQILTLPEAAALRFRQNPSAKSLNAHKQLSRVLEFYQKEFNWNGPANKGWPIYLATNFAIKIQTSGGFECDGIGAGMLAKGDRKIDNLPANAYLIRVQYMLVDTPDDVADDLDVIGHEFTHGVFNSHFGFRELDNRYGLASIDEGYADIMGITIRAWFESGKSLKHARIRSDSFDTGIHMGRVESRLANRPYQPIRNLADPKISGLSDHIDDFDLYGQFYPTVHTGAGIMHLPFTLMVAGGSHPRQKSYIAVKGIGFEKSATIFFNIIKSGLAFGGYRSFASAARQSAENIYGANSMEYITTDRAFAAVGLVKSDKVYPKDQPDPDADLDSRLDPRLDPRLDTRTPKPQTHADQSQPDSKSARLTLSGPDVLVALALLLGGLIYLASLIHKRRTAAVIAQYNSMVRPSSVAAGSINIAPEPKQPSALADQTGSCACTVTVAGQTYTVTLTSDRNTPYTVGREHGAFKALLALDPTISRKHFDMGVTERADELYIVCYSTNGLRVDGHSIGAGEKIQIDFSGPVTLGMGQTTLVLTKGSP